MEEMEKIQIQENKINKCKIILNSCCYTTAKARAISTKPVIFYCWVIYSTEENFIKAIL